MMRFPVPGRRKWLCLLALTVLCAAAARADNQRTDTLRRAFHHLYSFEFDAANEVLDGFHQRYPGDPMGYGVRAAVYLFYELDRLGLLASGFFQDQGEKLKGQNLKPDPELKAKLLQVIHEGRRHAEWALEKDPKDPEALFALSTLAGVESDYVFLVEKKRMGSLSLKKESHGYSRRLLEIDPSYYDAYLTTGFYEYLVGDLPFFVRWFVRFEDVQGRKQTGFERLQLVAASGKYCAGFAKILLAALYLREKRLEECRDVLAELVAEYPKNPLFPKELNKIRRKLGLAQAAGPPAAQLGASSPDASGGLHP